MNPRHEEHDEDQDSLFGSPPPSPRLSTGRPASPALALPSAPGSSTSGRRSSTSTAHATTQNVGTIALPGSQPDSELPINPLALSLNLGIVHRPPAQLSPAAASSSSIASTSAAVTATQGNHTWQRNVASTSTFAAPSRASQSRSVTPTTSSSSTRSANKPSRKRSRPSSRATSNEPPPEPRGPEFLLPDPSAPPPSHFLRNQENLLGKAGVVAGVKPSTLTHTRGSTPSNPIVVEEEEDTPQLGRRSRGGFARPYVDPSLLTAPSNQEIVSVLIGQKNIFPILEGVLKLVVGNAAATVEPRTTAFQSKAPAGQFRSRQSTPAETTSSSENPPLKKRKLSRVPAGAVDWDVPYPFKEGEGPEAYEKRWERERGKQLISQLIQQIKVAARKAATKKYLQQQKEKQTAHEAEERRRHPAAFTNTEQRPTSHYRPVTATYGLSEEEKSKVYDALQHASNASCASKPSAPSQSTVSRPEPTTAVTRPSPLNVDFHQSTTSTFEQLTNSYIASMQSTAMQGHGQGAAGNASDIDFTLQDLSLNSHFPQLPTDPQISTSSLPTGLDQCSFDSWMNLFLQNIPPSSFDFTSCQFEDFSSTSTSTPPSHCSTPAPSGFDDFSFGDILGTPTTGVDVEGSSALPPSSSNPDDVNAMLNSVFNQSAPADNTFDPNFLSNADFGLNNLDMNFPGMDTNTSGTQAASPIASTSSFTGSLSGSVNDPATPASAAWDISLPDVHMGDGGDDASGQGMWRDTMWDFNGMNTYSGIPSFVGWGAGMSADEPTQDFGNLPEPKVVQKQVDQADTAVENNSVDKGKGKCVDPFLEVTTSETMSLPPVTPEDVAFRALIDAPPATAIVSTPESASIAPAPLLPFTTAQTTTVASTTPAPPTARDLRKQRKDDILKRAKEKRQKMQEELDEVKKQLWATTVEQAGLLMTLRKVEEEEMRESNLSSGSGFSEGSGLKSVPAVEGADVGVS